MGVDEAGPPLPCSDAAVKDRTGRDWAEWRALLDAENARDLEHRALARWIDSQHDAGSWWSQTVAVGYERLIGRRAPGQAADGRFQASVSKTLPVSAAAAHDRFVVEALRREWLDGELEIRRATAPKSVRITWVDGSSVEVWITAKGDAKCSVSLQHSKLADAAAVAESKAFWKEAMQRLAATVS